MKKLITIIALAISISSYGQITLEHTYPPSNYIQVSVVNLSISGYKYVTYSSNRDTVKLYDLTHSLWKSIAIPIPIGQSIGLEVSYISETLFNSDNLVEFLYGTRNRSEE